MTTNPTGPLGVSSPEGGVSNSPLTHHTIPHLAAAAQAIRTDQELLTTLVDSLVTDVAILGAKPEWSMSDNMDFTECYTGLLIDTLQDAGVTLADAVATVNISAEQILDEVTYRRGTEHFSRRTRAALNKLVSLA